MWSQFGRSDVLAEIGTMLLPAPCRPETLPAALPSPLGISPPQHLDLILSLSYMLPTLLRRLLGGPGPRLGSLQPLPQCIRSISLGSDGLLRPICSLLGLIELHQRAVSLGLRSIPSFPKRVDLPRMCRLDRG